MEPELEPEPKHRVREYSEARLELYARLAWLSSYRTVYELEAQMNGAAADVEHYQSDYRRQQMDAGNDDARKRSMLRVSQDYERLLREEDMHYVPFSQAKAPRRQRAEASEEAWEEGESARGCCGSGDSVVEPALRRCTIRHGPGCEFGSRPPGLLGVLMLMLVRSVLMVM